MATPTSNGMSDYSFDPSGVGGAPYLLWGTKWGGALGTGATLSYSFPTDTANFIGDYSDEWDAWFSLSSQEREAVRDVLATWDDYANIGFYEVFDNEFEVGDLRFTLTGNVDPGSAAHAYFPGGHPSAGDVWFGIDSFNTDSDVAVPRGSFDYHTILHEVGHALGLKHPFSGGDTIDPQFDNYFYTVMSYTASPWSDLEDSEASFYPTTPMYLDLLALQALYGPNTTINTGDTVYTYYEGNYYWEAINDAGGFDTIVYVGGQDSVIDLSPGAFSELSDDITFSGGTTSRSTVTIGPGVRIEGAKGGGGNDTILGNGSGNLLRGSQGDDRLEGYRGSDRLKGGSGGDKLVGAKGKDKLVGGSGEDRLQGSKGADYLSAGAQDDVLRGSKGDDRLVAGIGEDRLFGGADRDVFLFRKVAHSSENAGITAIRDLRRKQDDRVDLKRIDADETSGGNQAFDFIGTNGFSGEAGELRYSGSGGGVRVYGDVDGDRSADFVLDLNRLARVKADDFVL